ncbi:MAG TPA: DUF1801 domain-containing protein [Chitinophagaceae bacterium]|nr:DUF1801 domain-containing protein [Chitinophagaceae bacterium]
MAAKIKTDWTGEDVKKFIETSVDDEQKKTDSYQLITLMRKWSGFKPEMWGPTIVGFGRYHYRYASGHEGDAPVIGFSPRKAAFSLYVYSPTKTSDKLLQDLGKYKMGKACIYVKKLADIDIAVLEKLCRESIQFVKTKYPEQ